MSVDKVLPVLGTLLGALVGGLVTEFRTLLKGAREKRQALSLLLFELLELRFVISRWNPAMIYQALLEAIAQRFGAETAAAVEDSSSKQVLMELFGTVVADIRKTVNTVTYEETVAAVAPFDPILAYQMRGGPLLSRWEQYIEGYSKQVKSLPEFDWDPDAASVLQSFESAAIKEQKARLLKQLEQDCLSVAKRISRKAVPETEQILARQDQIDENSIRQFYVEAIDSFIEMFEASQKYHVETESS